MELRGAKGRFEDPADKRLAVHMRDHPVDHAVFERVLPEGNYRADSVKL